MRRDEEFIYNFILEEIIYQKMSPEVWDEEIYKWRTLDRHIHPRHSDLIKLSINSKSREIVKEKRVKSIYDFLSVYDISDLIKENVVRIDGNNIIFTNNDWIINLNEYILDKLIYEILTSDVVHKIASDNWGGMSVYINTKEFFEIRKKLLQIGYDYIHSSSECYENSFTVKELVAFLENSLKTGTLSEDDILEIKLSEK